MIDKGYKKSTTHLSEIIEQDTDKNLDDMSPIQIQLNLNMNFGERS